MKYFITHGPGLDVFVRRELADLSKVSAPTFTLEVSDMTLAGKVLFSCDPSSGSASTGIELLQHLKTVERLFAHLFVETNCHRFWKHNKTPLILSSVYKYVSDQAKVISPVLDDILHHVVEANPNQEPESSECSYGKRPKTSKSFRVNAKIAGRFRKHLREAAVAKCVGAALIKNLPDSENWCVDLRSPRIEITVYLNDEALLCGISLCGKPLSERKYLDKIPLRSTIAYAMAMLAVQDETRELNSLIALDPMCGCGTILIELAKHFPQILFTIGMDNNIIQVQQSLKNIESSNETVKVTAVLNDSSLAFPLRTDIIDCVVCDVPFGIQHLTSEDAKSVLPKLLSVIDTVLKGNGNVVLLVSSTLLDILSQSINELELIWIHQDSYPVRLGKLPASICHYRKKEINCGS